METYIKVVGVDDEGLENIPQIENLTKVIRFEDRDFKTKPGNEKVTKVVGTGKKDLNSKTERVEEAIRVLSSMQYDYIKVVGTGTFGSVIAVDSDRYCFKIAAKIEMAEEITEGELAIWRNLHHENILPLLEWKYQKTSDTWVFIMPLLPYGLDKKLEDPSFTNDPKAFEKAVSWLKGITNGLSYLHSQSLGHLDLKTNNVLISTSDEALLCDFGLLSKLDGPTRE